MTRVGLVLGGGGVAGYAFHLGALAAIEEVTGWDPRDAEIVLGTSAGSLVAAGLRGGLSPVDLMDRVSHSAADSLDAVTGAGNLRLPAVWKGPASPSLLAQELGRGLNARPSNLVAAALPEGRLPTSPLRTVVEDLHGHTWPTRPLWIPATELDTGRRIVFGRQSPTAVDVATAVEASCAIPGYFAPVVIDGRRHVDGGMRCPDNADLLIDTDLDSVVIVSPLSLAELRPGRSPLLSVLRAYPRRRLRRNADRLGAAGCEVTVIEPDLDLARIMGLNAMNARRLEPVVAATRSSVESALRQGVGLSLA